jgi:hypothetical protein
MKHNKFSLVALIALSGLMACGPVARAQTNTAATNAAAARARAPRGGGAAGQALQAALDKLDLTPDEKTKVAAAVADQRTKTAGLRGTTPPLTAAERRAKVKEISDAFDASLKGILTDEQYKKWLEVKPPAGGRRGGRGARGAGAGTPPAGGTNTATPTP